MLKTYRALSMAAALTEVKKDLGADAVIVNTRTLRAGGVLGIGARNVIEITASPGPPRAAGGGGQARRPESARERLTVSPQTSARPAVQVSASSRPSADRLVEPRPVRRVAADAGFTPIKPRDLHEAIAAARPRTESVAATAARGTVASQQVGAESESAVAVLEPPALEAAFPEATPTHAAPRATRVEAPLATAARLSPVSDAARAAIDEELASIKRMVVQVLQTSRQTALRVADPAKGALSTTSIAGASTEPLMAMSIRLLDAQLAPDLADVLLGKVRDELSPAELADEAIVREATLRHLARAIPIAPDSTLRRSDSGRPLTLALVGPTGVGKTTTIAKLAAALKLRHAKKVGLVTSDTYRIAAVEQLRTYANIIGLPLKIAHSPEDMAAACESHADCDVILVDTAGRSQHDADRLDELRRQRDAAQPHQTHLVLAANACESVLLRAAERFRALQPDRLLITKLDEAVAFGPVVNVATRIGLGLSFVTTGQEVPDHIERARAERLARMVLDGGVGR
ncbi:MAG: flagellar biosynthesis protein FlhF [Phycisphaerales bacterium]